MSQIKVLLLCIVFFIAGYLVSKYIPGEADAKVQPSSVSQNLAVDVESLDQLESVQSGTNEENCRPLLMENKEQVARLDNEITRLEKTVTSKAIEQDRALSSFAQKKELNASQANELSSSLEISKEEAESLLPKPFSIFFVGATGARAKKLKEFNAQPVDYDWGYTMETYINGFFAAHYQGVAVNLESVVCKTSACEIRGFETSQNSASIILNDMRGEEWWKFSRTSSSSRDSTEFGSFFYVLLSK